MSELWSREQGERLAFEAQLLARYMSSFHFVNTAREDTRVEGSLRSGGGKTYAGRVQLLANYPHQQPQLLIVSPRKLPMHDGEHTLDGLGGSHAYHVLGTSAEGYLRICHTRSWDPSMNCVNVITKFAVWVDCYEKHLRTGKSIDHIMKEEGFGKDA